MHPFVKLGTFTDLPELAVELKRRMVDRGLDATRSFPSFADQILTDHPDHRALVLPAGTVIEGDVRLDFEGLTSTA